jgi:hypothetical protein
MGFSPAPTPKLIATFPTKGPALAVSRGLDRDRVVDETGNQTVVFGRRGSRPFHLDEIQKHNRHADGTVYKVEDVSVRENQLQSRSGAALKQSGQFQGSEETFIQAPRRNRLERRGN